MIFYLLAAAMALGFGGWTVIDFFVARDRRRREHLGDGALRELRQLGAENAARLEAQLESERELVCVVCDKKIFVRREGNVLLRVEGIYRNGIWEHESCHKGEIS